MSEFSGEFQWSVVALEPQIRDPEKGVILKLRGSHQSEATIELCRTRQGMWTWRWTESWMGHTTVSEPRRSWLKREHAAENLAMAAHLYYLPQLACDILNRWR